ncbi:hypothetical protein GCM10009557_06310 [Virgisporangium ochraceum]|uniref:Heat shock protein 70 n=1 Tax=Virgisporangium ochraceum TaxID=65505 RepID=A0A8J4A6U4_9ACTN|nr:Hsp70 family protein [Virgisporangium ochraceum]GIJ75263.1 hypothetical protein Voc01_101800 [Virgisporangium ochraceum]
MSTSGYRLGIDFGTSTTVAILASPDGRLRPLLFDATPLMPSAVFCGGGDDLSVGADALRAAMSGPAGFEPNPKQRVDEGTVLLGEREHRVVELIAAVLRPCAREAFAVAKTPLTEVVVTHPAAWGPARCAVLREAASRAGLAGARMMPEPVAAAAYFASLVQPPSRPSGCLLVYDLGAGTFDVSVLRWTADGFRIVAVDGLDDVGGLYLDAVIVEHAAAQTADARDEWRRLRQPETYPDRQARQALWQGARAAKELLSRNAQAELYVPIVGRSLHVTREEFEAAIRGPLSTTVALTTELRRRVVAAEEQAELMLIGGASRTPLAATLLLRALQIAPTVVDQPELVVAEGALLAPADIPPPVAAVHTLPPPVGTAWPPPEPRFRGVAAVPPPTPPAPTQVDRPTADEPSQLTALPTEQATTVLLTMPTAKAARLISRLPTAVVERIVAATDPARLGRLLALLRPFRAAGIISRMDDGQALVALRSLPPERTTEVLDRMPGPRAVQLGRKPVARQPIAQQPVPRPRKPLAVGPSTAPGRALTAAPGGSAPLADVTAVSGYDRTEARGSGDSWVRCERCDIVMKGRSLSRHIDKHDATSPRPATLTGPIVPPSPSSAPAPTAPAMSLRRDELRQRVRAGTPDEFTTCPACRAKVKYKNLLRHVDREHHATTAR